MMDWLTSREGLTTVGMVAAAAFLGWALARWRKPRRRVVAREEGTSLRTDVAELRGELNWINRQITDLTRTSSTQTDTLAAVQRDVGSLREQVAALAVAPPAPAGSAALPGAGSSGYGDGGDFLRRIDLASSEGVERVPLGPSGAVRGAAPYLDGAIPVEVRDERIVRSSSLPPIAFLVPQGSGQAQVWLNPEAGLNEFAVDKWAAYFELRGGRANAVYDTLEPAVVGWSGEAGSTDVVRQGVAVAR
jgi:hypothetical protein